MLVCSLFLSFFFGGGDPKNSHTHFDSQANRYSNTLHAALVVTLATPHTTTDCSRQRASASAKTLSNDRLVGLGCLPADHAVHLGPSKGLLKKWPISFVGRSLKTLQSVEAQTRTIAGVSKTFGLLDADSPTPV